MAGNDRWIQDALDAWLSPEPGTGPEGDEGWRERTGYFKSVWGSGEGVEAEPSEPSAAQPGAPEPATSREPGRSWLAAGYDEARARLRAAMTGFMDRLFHAFPDRTAMTIDDLAAAAGWIAEMERQVRVAGGWAVLHKVQGRPQLGREVDAALAELAQLKQAYALQRGRIEQRDAERIRQINRDTGAFVRGQEARRRELAREADDYAERLRRETEREQQRLRDEQHRRFLGYLRDERVFEIREL
jgi:hypothetical protein